MRFLLAGGGTGGHLMPALALADALVDLDRSVEPVLIGAQRGVEAAILPQRPYRYHLLPFEPLHRRAWWRNVRWPLLAWRLRRACNSVLDSEMPTAVLGTGGYASGPVLFYASKRHIPIALQEQNAYPGVATRFMARRARQIHLGFPEASRHLRPGPSTTVYVSGNPIVPPPSRLDRPGARAEMAIPDDTPVLLVTGGSQGADSINRVISRLIDDGSLDGIVLLWSTGRSTWSEYARYHHPPTRIVREFWDPIGHAYAVADLAIARAGAMTTAELCAWGIPAIYVPLPGAAADHQTKNAAALAEAGAAVLIPQPDLTPESLRVALHELLEAAGRRSSMAAAARARGKPEAAREIASRVLSMVS